MTHLHLLPFGLNRTTSFSVAMKGPFSSNKKAFLAGDYATGRRWEGVAKNVGPEENSFFFQLSRQSVFGARGEGLGSKEVSKSIEHCEEYLGVEKVTCRAPFRHAPTRETRSCSFLARHKRQCREPRSTKHVRSCLPCVSPDYSGLVPNAVSGTITAVVSPIVRPEQKGCYELKVRWNPRPPRKRYVHHMPPTLRSATRLTRNTLYTRTGQKYNTMGRDLHSIRCSPYTSATRAKYYSHQSTYTIASCAQPWWHWYPD